MKHTCHAKGCNQNVPPRLLMCARHWRMVPKELQAKVWKHYKPGQEITKTPTLKYLKWSRRAVKAVAKIESKS